MQCPARLRHFDSYGVSVTTLEEVFLKVASDSADHKNLGHLEQLRRDSSASAMNTQDAPKGKVSRRRGCGGCGDASWLVT